MIQRCMGLEFKKMLCQVDLSEFSLQARVWRSLVAENSGTALDVLHVIHNPFAEIYLSDIAQTDPALMELYVQ